MIKAFPNKQEVIIPPHQNRITNMMQYGEEKQRIFENYLL
jgi:UDP-N-acetylmuramoylalanine-D-glutamate ligase